MKYNAETSMATFTELDNFEMQMEFVEANELHRRLEQLTANTKVAEKKRISQALYKIYLSLCKE